MAFSSVLVANRGEIAVRVIRAARARGLRTIAVHSDADVAARHVREADLSLRLGPAPALASYLDVDALLDAARRSGAEAVHPGYGFLSENAGFARAVTEAGLTFIGPDARVIELMGRKDRARAVAERAGVPGVPSAVVTSDEPPHGVPFPLMIKAAAGGGGKGMRIVHDPAAFAEAVQAARREARTAFGDDTMIVEQYVERGRHVEVQVLGDLHGNVVHLFERDCSAQRRHQKVVEESPAPGISPALRTELTDAAVRLARSVGYTNAGTVEFMVAGDTIHFLEMNTRIQVEHPVTELVTGLDLVDLQLAIAAGEPLPFDQADVRQEGHAIEARVYAEDPDRGHLPQTGTVDLLSWGRGVRVDTALETGQVVGTSYDPLLAKVVAHGPTREAARARLVTALRDTAILGLTTNIGFLADLVESTPFAELAVDTSFLDRTPHPTAEPDWTTHAIVAAWVLSAPREPGAGPFGVGDGWRLAAANAPWAVRLTRAGVTVAVSVDRPAGCVTVDGRAHTVRASGQQGALVRLEVDGVVRRAHVLLTSHGVAVSVGGHAARFEVATHAGLRSAAATSDGTIRAPMPGVVLSVDVEPGQRVRAGEVLATMEAMKMELALRAPADGHVTEVLLTTGDQLAMGDRIFVLEPSDA